MIFVTLGSQKFQFDRLLCAIDDLVEREIITDNVFAQIGYSTYSPNNYKYKNFLDREEFAEFTQKADIVITHGGTGAIIGAVKQGKKVIAVPRLSKYGEHVDDHQLQLVSQFQELDLICACLDCGKLADALEYVQNHTFKSYTSNTRRILDSIEDFIAAEVTKV